MPVTLAVARHLVILPRRRLLGSASSASLPSASSPPPPQPTRSKRCPHRNYSSTRSTPAWWNPFLRTDSGRDSGAQLGSARTQGGSDADSPRRIQERKDATLALLALEFRRLSLEQPSKDREEVIDAAFESLEQKDLDAKTILQLRHELQTALEKQVVQLFQAMRRVDESLAFDLDDTSDATGNGVLDRTLQLELERTIDDLANATPPQAPKGASPTAYMEIRRGALETLTKKRTAYREAHNQAASQVGEGDNSEGVASKGTKQVSWVDADHFGYHETINADRNQQIRHYQAINICRAAKMRDEWGYSVVALQSSIAGAGRGVFVDGYAKAGSILAFQPGEVWSKEHLVNLPVETERQLEKNDQYQMSLRPDDFMIDSRKSPYTVLTGNNTNMMALGHVINHPTPTKPPNCRCIMINFTQGMDLGSSLKQYIPNTYARPRALTIVGSLWDRDAVDMHGMCLIATRDICNEEIFYDYRLMTSRLPSWYHTVQDLTYDQPPDPDEK
jgi:hypothetical protein